MTTPMEKEITTNVSFGYQLFEDMKIRMKPPLYWRFFLGMFSYLDYLWEDKTKQND